MPSYRQVVVLLTSKGHSVLDRATNSCLVMLLYNCRVSIEARLRMWVGILASSKRMGPRRWQRHDIISTRELRIVRTFPSKPSVGFDIRLAIV